MGVCAAFAVVFTLVILQYSFRHGRLILFPAYDDVDYFAEAVEAVQVFYDHGFVALLKHYRDRPPHSPYSSGLATVAFLVFGIRDWAPYAANALLLFGFFAFADYLLKGVALWQKVLFILFLCTVPLVGMASHEFRPDHAVSLLTVVGVFVLLTRPFVRSPLRHKLVAGAFFGLAMLTKPPVFPATVTFFVAALVLATLSDRFGRGQRFTARRAAAAWAPCAVPFILIPLPHYLIHGGYILHYIYDILFGSQREAYLTRGDLSHHLKFYLTGHAAKVMLGRHFTLLVAFLLALTALFLLRRRRLDLVTGAALALVLLLSYAIPTVNQTKQEFFGLTFHIMLAYLVIYLLGRLILSERLSRDSEWLLPLRRVRVMPVVLLAMLAWGLCVFQWPTRHANFNTDWMVNRRQIVDGLYRTILKNAPHDQPRVLLTGIGDVNVPLLEYMARRDMVPLDAYIPEPDTDDPQPYLSALPDVDFVIAAESGTSLVSDFLASYRIQDYLLAKVRAREEFAEIARFTYRRTGRNFYLFQRRDFVGYTPLEGLGPPEGPHPKHHLRLVRWGLGPATRLKATAPTAGAYELFFSARTSVSGQEVTVTVNGREVTRLPMTASYDYMDTRVPLSLTAGENDIELHYAAWDRQDPRPMAVLYKSLRLKPSAAPDGAPAVPAEPPAKVTPAGTPGTSPT